jgi:nuclear pore complex protein Nup133
LSSRQLSNPRSIAPYRAFFRSTASAHYAGATTHDSVIIWDYDSSSREPSTRVLNLPSPLKSSDPLPIASLTTNASTSEIGLVLVYPATGKIYLFENVDNGQSLSLFQRQQSIEGQFKLMGGETVEDIVDAEHAGFVLLTSAGRLAQLTLRDAQGRPQVGVALLAHNGSKGSFLGELVGMFHSSWRNRTVSVSTRQSTKGRMEIVGVTSDGIFRVWDATWAGQNSFLGEVDVLQNVQDAIISAKVFPPEEAAGSIRCLDFALLTRLGSDSAEGTSPIRAILLVAYQTSSASRFVLVHLNLASGAAQISHIMPIDVFTGPRSLSERPHLLLSKPTHTATIVFEKTVVVVSLPDLSVVPQENNEVLLPSTYQDVVHLKSGVSISASVAEPPSPKQDASNTLLFASPVGVIRLAAQQYPERLEEGVPDRPSPMSKLEQIIFFAGLTNPILDLSNISTFGYSLVNVEKAALEVSNQIVKSDSDYIPKKPASMEEHLVDRARYLHNLAVYLKSTWPGVTRATRFQLLWNAERLAAARALWSSAESELDQKDPKGYTLLEQAVDETLQRYLDDDTSREGKQDDLRTFFSMEIGRLDKLLSSVANLVYKQIPDDTIPKEARVDILQEAATIFISSLSTAFEFRHRNLSLYGLGAEDLDEDGVLRSNYKGIPQPWTSQSKTVNSLSVVATSVVTAIHTWYGNTVEAKSIPDDAKVYDLTIDLVKLVRLSCKIQFERYSWLQAQDSDKEKEQGSKLQQQFENELRRKQIIGVAKIGQVDRALALAEEMHDLHALVHISLKELDHQKSMLASHGHDQKLDKIQSQIARYFRKFGNDFGKLFYTSQMKTHRLGDVLDLDLGPKPDRTAFLRSKPSYAKVSWVNDVLNETDLLQASNSLLQIAKTREPAIWGKNLELSIAKLALQALDAEAEAANGEADARSQESIKAALKATDRELVSARIQQQLFNFIKPSLVDAVDEEAWLNEAMAMFGKRIQETRPALAELLRLSFLDLKSLRAMSSETLIDILTLMDHRVPVASTFDPSAEPAFELSGPQFYLALKVLDSASFDDERKDMLKRLIWKRCLVKEDWASVAQTNEKSDRHLDENLSRTLALNAIKLGIQEGEFFPFWKKNE